MLDKLFGGIFDNTSSSVISISDFLLCLFISLLAGILLAAAYTYKSKYTKSFLITLAVIPAVVCLVIMMVNGNIGAGVAVAGTFSLVRFRSVPGTAKEICAIFLAMAAGLATGMGYLAYGLLFSAIMAGITLLYSQIDIGQKDSDCCRKTVRITIPESLDYSGVSDDLFEDYTSANELVQVRTTNMGSLFRLTYNLTLKNPSVEKELIDKIRCRNGNLEISSSRQETDRDEL